ncbi:MAG: signal peptidase II [Marinosulfonomonas sp.]|nr:signal peptidase II [Marinosulfonomonas sp.]
MIWTGVAVFLLDQASKYLVVQVLDLKTVGSLDIAPPYLTLRMAWNRGVNFGLFSNDTDIMRWVLIAAAILISGWVVIWISRESSGVLAKVAAGLLVGGALGNVADRLIYGAVADFLNMSCCGINNPYAFNVADIAVFAGAIGLILFSGNKKST